MDETVLDSRCFLWLHQLNLVHFISGVLRRSLASGVRICETMDCLIYSICLYERGDTPSSIVIEPASKPGSCLIYIIDRGSGWIYT